MNVKCFFEYLAVRSARMSHYSDKDMRQMDLIGVIIAFLRYFSQFPTPGMLLLLSSALSLSQRINRFGCGRRVVCGFCNNYFVNGTLSEADEGLLDGWPGGAEEE